MLHSAFYLIHVNKSVASVSFSQIFLERLRVTASLNGELYVDFASEDFQLGRGKGFCAFGGVVSCGF